MILGMILATRLPYFQYGSVELDENKQIILIILFKKLKKF